MSAHCPTCGQPVHRGTRVMPILGSLWVAAAVAALCLYLLGVITPAVGAVIVLAVTGAVIATANLFPSKSS